MKQKVFTLLTLFVLCVTGAWATPTTVFSYTVTEGTAKDAKNVAATGGTVDISADAVESKNSQPYAAKLGSSGYIKCTLTSGTLSTGDVISLTIYQNSTASPAANTYGVTVASSTDVSTFDGTVYVPTASGKTAYTGTMEVGSDLNGRSVFYVRRNASSSMYCASITITHESAAAAPASPSFTPNGGSVEGTSTTTIASTNAQKIYYCWTDNATAPAQDAEATWTVASGDSKVFAIPNVTASGMYLHAYGWNNYGGSSFSATSTSSAFNVTKKSAAAKTYNFACAFTDELKAILVDETTGKFNYNGTRYESKSSITKDIDNDLGTYSGVTEWNGLIFGRIDSNIGSGSLRIQENGYIQINGGKGYYKLEGLYDGDIVKIRCASSSSELAERTFTVTGATPSSISVNSSNAGYHDFTLTKSGTGDLTINQSNGINVWTIAINTDLPAVPTVAVSTATGNTYATVVTSYALDFSTVSEDITAYIVTEKGANTVTTEAVTKVPANTAILVKTASAGSSVDVPRAFGATALSTNKLKYSASPIEVNTTNDNVGKIYAFFKVAGQYGFAPVAEDTSLPANKAYLEIDGGELKANFLALDMDGGTTAINKVEAAKNNAGEYFNLAGQRVAQPTKGLYIVNGKKVIIK